MPQGSGPVVREGEQVRGVEFGMAVAAVKGHIHNLRSGGTAGRGQNLGTSPVYGGKTTRWLQVPGRFRRESPPAGSDRPLSGVFLPWRTRGPQVHCVGSAGAISWGVGSRERRRALESPRAIPFGQ